MNQVASLIPAMPSLGSIPMVVWIAVGVLLVPLAVVFGGLLVKIGWGMWPVPLALALSGYAVYRLGIEWFWLMAIGVGAAIVGTWLWQRSRVFLAGDRFLEKAMFLGD